MNKKRVLKIIILLITVVIVVLTVGKTANKREKQISFPLVKTSWWAVQSIDTMKYSRDIAREKLNDPSFDIVIEDQVKKIAQAGATHVAIATPYDSEFLPYLKRWVTAARKYKLKVWFRGNFSGWEEWFNYPRISRNQHLQMAQNFILNNPNLFVDGDLFSSCPECENGGPGDPRFTGDVTGHRQFLISEYAACKQAFKKIGKQVQANMYSMNGDVAKLIMDPLTTNSLDGLVVVDHYVANPEKLVSDLNYLVSQSKGQIFLGEMGAPIPDIHGQMTEAEQALWLEQALTKINNLPHLIGINYWTNLGSSSQLWNQNGQPKQALAILKKYFQPPTIDGTIVNQLNEPIYLASVATAKKTALTDENGYYCLPYLETSQNITVTAKGYKPVNMKITQAKSLKTISLQKEKESLWFKLKKEFFNFSNK